LAGQIWAQSARTVPSMVNAEWLSADKRATDDLRCEGRFGQRRSFHDVGSMPVCQKANDRHGAAISVAASPNGTLWNVGQLTDYSGLMLAALITFAHFSVSSAMNFPNSMDVNDIG
jgi:hypothetical protein